MAETEDDFYDDNGDMILPPETKRARTLGPFDGMENHIMEGRCPEGEYYAEILSIHRGGWNSDKWEEMAEWLEDHGFETYIRRSSGTTRTRSGTSKSASTSLYYW